MSSYLYSIIIPVYNVEVYLEQCLGSAINQTYKNYEIICVNDGSTDRSLEIIKQFAVKSGKLRVISQGNRGLSSARNAGINQAEGKYILFLDGDDWLEVDALEKLSKTLGNGQHDMVCFRGSLYHDTEDRPEKDLDLEEGIFSGWDYYNRYVLRSRKFHFVSAVLRLYRKDFLLHNKLLFKEGIFHEDNLFTPLACYHAKSVRVVNIDAYHYRIRPGSITQTHSFKRISDKISITNELCAFFIPLHGLDKRKLYRVLASDYLGVFIGLNSGEYNFSDIRSLIDYRSFREVGITPRHRLMFYLVMIHPSLLIFYIKLVKVIR